MKKQYVWTNAVLIALATICCIGCSDAESHQDIDNTNLLRVTILDSGDYYHSDAGIDNGIRMALEKISAETDVDIEINIVEDGGDYAKGISLAQELAADEEVDVVLSFQNFESIGAEMPFFEEAEKPFLVTMGCYDEVTEQGYQYFLADFLSGKAIGERIGEYLIEQNVSDIALCHSDTVFEKDEISGLQRVLKDNQDIRVRDSMTGPFHEEDLADMISRSEKLGIDAVVANFYNQEDSAWLIGELRTICPQLVVVGDYALDSTEILQEYGEKLEGAVIVPVYPYNPGEKLDVFVREYEEYSGHSFSTATLQYYELFTMLADCFAKTKDSKAGLMQALKSEEGYEGVTGTLRFDENGCLQAEECPMFVCRNGEFVALEGR